MKIRLVIATAIAVCTYLILHLVSEGAADPALLAWCASGVFGLVLGFGTLSRVRTARLLPIAPRPFALPTSGGRSDDGEPFAGSAVSRHEPQPHTA